MIMAMIVLRLRLQETATGWYCVLIVSQIQLPVLHQELILTKNGKCYGKSCFSYFISMG